MIEISETRAAQIREAFVNGSDNILAIEMHAKDDSIYMTVNRHLVGITEYKIVQSRKCEHGRMPWECSDCDDVKKDHEIAEHVNNLRDIAIKYANTQQLREHIRREVLKFMMIEE